MPIEEQLRDLEKQLYKQTQLLELIATQLGLEEVRTENGFEWRVNDNQLLNQKEVVGKIEKYKELNSTPTN